MIADSYFCGWEGRLGFSEEFRCRFGSIVGFVFFKSLSSNTTILLLYPLKCSQSIFVIGWFEKVSKKNWKSS